MAVDDHALGPLPCGVVLDDLIAQITDGVAPFDRAHQAMCEYCQAALETFQRAWQEFQDLARAAVAVPEDLAERVMHRVRELSRGEPAGVLVAEDRGQTRVAEIVLARVARATALTVPGVVWASVVSAGADRDGVGEVRVSVRLVVTYGPSLPKIADVVRERVLAAVHAQTGTLVAAVDVAVDDVTVADENL